MKNLTTTIQKGLGYGTTTRVTKTIDILVNNREMKLSVFRNEDSMYSFKSSNYYSIEFKGEFFGSDRMGKSQLKWQLDFMKTEKFTELFA